MVENNRISKCWISSKPKKIRNLPPNTHWLGDENDKTRIQLKKQKKFHGFSITKYKRKEMKIILDGKQNVAKFLPKPTQNWTD